MAMNKPRIGLIIILRLYNFIMCSKENKCVLLFLHVANRRSENDMDLMT